MDGPRRYYVSEISQTEKDKYCMTSLACGIYKTKQKPQTKQNRNRLIDIRSKLVVAGAGRGWRAGKIGEED